MILNNFQSIVKKCKTNISLLLNNNNKNNSSNQQKEIHYIGLQESKLVIQVSNTYKSKWIYTAKYKSCVRINMQTNDNNYISQ